MTAKARARARSGRTSAGWLTVFLPLIGCASGVSDLSHARRLMAAGEFSRACIGLTRMVREQSEQGGKERRTRRLDTLRTWVSCHHKIGALDDLERELLALPRDGGRLYAEALLAVARTPGGIDRALSLLERAGASWTDQAEIPHRAGILLMLDEQPAAALRHLEQASRIDETARTAAARAHVLLDLGRAEEALAQAERILLRRPRPADLAAGRSLIMRISRRSRRMPPGATRAFEAALDLLHRQGRAGVCVRKVEELLLQWPEQAAAHTLLGLAHLRLANNAAAVTAFRRAEELNPLDASNPYYLGMIYRQQNLKEQGVKALRRALRRDPFRVGVARSLGRLLIDLRQMKEAARVLDRVALLSQRSEPDLRLAGRAHLAAGSLGRAQRVFSRLDRENPNDFEAKLRMGQLLLQRYKSTTPPRRDLLKRSFSYGRRAAKLRPDDAELQQLLRELDDLSSHGGH